MRRSGVHVMEQSRRDNYMIINNCIIVLLSLSIFLAHFTSQSEARTLSKQLQIKGFHNLEDIRRSRSAGSIIIKTTNKLKQFKHLGMDPVPLDLPNSQSYGVSSPFTLPPFDSLAPTPLPQNTPPFCDYPPFTPLPPSTPIPTTPIIYTPPSPPSPSSPFVFTPIFPIQSPPQSPFQNPPQSPSESPPFSIPNPPENSPTTPTPPEYIPSPPTTFVPIPPEYVPSPSGPGNVPSPTVYVPSPPDYEPSPPMYVPSPIGYTPSPIGYTPSPTGYIPSPSGFIPSPPVFQPPVIFPPPSGPPSPFKGPQRALWCVAKPSVPDPIIQEAMNYACGSGADCGSIQPEGSCYHPETLFAHASFAFNSYWQRTKAAGGTCDFGGTAMLVTVDPSFDGCHFIAT